MVNHLETYYDALSATKQKEETPTLSPEVESFLKEMENRFKQDKGFVFLQIFKYDFQLLLLCYNYQQILVDYQYLLMG